MDCRQILVSEREQEVEFCTEGNTLFRPSDVRKTRHVKFRNSVNPYIDREYLRGRQKSGKYERGYRDKSFAM